uniref:Uncharacterized protein n=1 Tax=Aegilops tauschii TaxID=37682 RepID=R7W8F8_AEGTA
MAVSHSRSSFSYLLCVCAQLLMKLLSSPRTDLPHQATTSHLKGVDSQVTPSQGARWRRLRSHQIRSLRRICCSGRRSAVMVVDLQERVRPAKFLGVV